MRVLAITNLYPPTGGGGYGEICADLMEGLAARGHDIRVLTAENQGEPGSYDRNGVQVERVLRPVLAPWRRPLRGLAAVRHDDGVLRRQIAEFMPEVVVVWHMRGLMKTSLRLLEEAGVPVVYMLHDRWVLYERPGPWLRPWPILDRLGIGLPRELLGGLFARWIETRAPRIGDSLVYCNSEWLIQEYARLGWQPSDAGLIPCGVNADVLASWRREPVADPPRTLLFAGRVHRSKGLDVVVDAMSKVHQPFELTVAGPIEDASFVAELKQRIDRTGLGTRISWAGEVPRGDLMKMLGKFDALVYPSKEAESFGLGILEAFGTGAVVITSATGGPEEFLRDDENALVFPVSDVGACARALDRLATERGLASRLSTSARETARVYDIESVVAMVESAIQQSAANSAAAEVAR